MAQTLQHYQTALVAGVSTPSDEGIQPVLATAGSGRANAIISLSRWYKKSVRPGLFPFMQPLSVNLLSHTRQPNRKENHKLKAKTGNPRCSPTFRRQAG